MTVDRMQLTFLLWALPKIFRIMPMFNTSFRKRLLEKNFTAQIKTKDGIGRWYTFKNGKVTSGAGINPAAEVIVLYHDAETALITMQTKIDYHKLINEMKEYKLDVQGPDELSSWFVQTLTMMVSLMGRKPSLGVNMGKGVWRYTSGTNGGPVFVYVKKAKIIRITPIEFDNTDAKPWSIKARGKTFTPPRKTTLAPYAYSWKSLIYSSNRLLYPMKRIDFDPNGERNCENRGISEYVRIGWDEALDIVANEIKRVKKDYGPGAIMSSTGSHHTWGNIGYYLSAHHRFMNLIGYTPVEQNPDSWEGWYWGAMHHWGNSMRMGGSESNGTVEDALKECEMMVFWSSDPESTSGVYAGMEGTIRRLWIKELGVKFVHIDPFYNHTAALLGGKWLAPRPATGNALALAIAYVWITEDLYDKEYIERCTTGFDQWKDYILGMEDGIPKTPEWQEGEAGISAKDVRALAREWARNKTYLAAGGGGSLAGTACRDSTGIEWARSMVCLTAMRGHGKPGINMGNMQAGTPVDRYFMFPGYAEGGFSGSLADTGLAQRMFNRMPQIPTMNNSTQKIPRLRVPEAILDGKTEGYATDTKTIHAQLAEYKYPVDGHSPAKMYYKYGGSFIGTMSETNRYVKAYRTDKLEFVVNQSIWFEGEAKFADIILPACTNFERWDIGEFAHCGGYIMDSFGMCNHRVIHIQHKCIEPLGESKSDYDIFYELSKKLGISAMYSEGSTEFDWCKRLFDATDLPKITTWKKFLKKGYYVVPTTAAEGQKVPVGSRWFAEGNLKDTPDLTPFAADYNGKFGEGLQTQSGKIEFVCSSLKRMGEEDPERPYMTKYIPSWEGHHTKDLLDKYPLQLISPHPRYTFHTQFDAKDGTVNDIKDHRILLKGYYYWIARINPIDAEKRGIKNNDLVKIYNDRGAVICAAQVTARVSSGTTHSYSSSGSYDPVGEPGASPDRGGCINLLTSKRPIIKKSHSTSAGSCLVEIEKWVEVS